MDSDARAGGRIFETLALCHFRASAVSPASMGGRLSLPSRTSEVDEVVTSGSVHAEMIDELSVLTACVARVKP